MRRTSALLSTLAAVTVVLGLVISAAGATTGTAVYSIQFSDNGVSHSYTVTETVSPGSNASSDTLFLAVASGSWNVTYSRSVNSSIELQPFLPEVSNQSFSYSANGTTFGASITRSGTVPVSFQGKSYSLTSYAYSLQANGSVPDLSGLNLTAAGAMGGAPQTQLPTGLASTAMSAVTVKLVGSISAFPSGLVYSVKGTDQGTGSFSITLLSTTLPLSAVGASTTAQVASVGVGAGAAISALAIGLGVRHKQHGEKTTENKPEHWVD
jgi:hypothetical protein